MTDYGTARWRKSSYSMASGDCVEARWRKSSRSVGNGACVEARWAKSSHSSRNGSCAEVAQRTDCDDEAGTVTTMLLRDSKDPRGAVLEFTRAEWAAFIAAVKASA